METQHRLYIMKSCTSPLLHRCFSTFHFPLYTVHFSLHHFSLSTSGGGSNIRVGGKPRGSGGRKSPSGVQGQSHGRESGGRSPPEAEAKCEISVRTISNVFLYTILDLMNTRAGKGEYILQTHSTKFLWRFNGGGLNPPNPPSGYATGCA